tara:strand:- start:1301 stop:1846 length:546 start_codon:yes stop_codon:yes gene_type:complete
MSITWIRHARKKYKNKDNLGEYKHDSPVIDNCQKDIENLCVKLILESKVPDKIICSPFLRARQTSNMITELLKLNIPVEIDTTISEYLGWIEPKGKIADVDAITKRYITPKLGEENLKDVQKRVNKHINNLKHLNPYQNILIITHGIIISKICKKIYNINENFKELEGLTYLQNYEKFTSK